MLHQLNKHKSFEILGFYRNDSQKLKYFFTRTEERKSQDQC